MLKYFLIIFLGFSVSSFAEDRTTIFVNESGYSIGHNDAELDSDQLLSHLQELGVERVLLVVDVCAGPVELVEAYVALSKLKITSIDLKAVGKLEKGSCKNV
ncbi:MAG: hypothetical protein HRU26_13350 [Psychroserpens sp.]|nr:hypothetical protein [Psychroserpens sp.]